MAQKHRLKMESEIAFSQKHNKEHLVIDTETASQVLSELYRLRNRLVKAESALRKFMVAKHGDGE